MGLHCVLHESGAPTQVSHRLHRFRFVERSEVVLRGVDPRVVHQRQRFECTRMTLEEGDGERPTQRVRSGDDADPLRDEHNGVPDHPVVALAAAHRRAPAIGDHVVVGSR